MDGMEQSVVIVGCGLGTPETLTKEARQAIEDAEVVIGSERLIRELVPPGKETRSCNDNAVPHVIRKNAGRSIAVLGAGDPGYYDTARTLADELAMDVRIVPGVSCLSALCAKLCVPEDEVRTISVSGLENVNVAYEISRSPFTCLLTSGPGTTHTVLKSLYGEGLGELKIAAGSRLGQSDEEIYEGTVEDAREIDFPEPTTLLVWNTDWARYSVIGLPDQAFFRGTVPMTKFEVRNIAASKLEVRATDIIYDVGAGTGSVSVELSRRAYLGKVFSIERLPEAFYLLRKNRQHLRAFNMEIVSGDAPGVLENLPAPNKAFIGGSGGNISGIIGALAEKNPSVVIAATAATLETLEAAREAFLRNGFQVEVIQAGSSRLVPRGASYTMFEAINPVFVMVGRPKR